VSVEKESRRRQLRPLYAAGFVTAFGAHAVAANLGGYATGHHSSLVELGILLALYDGAEVVLKPVFGALADRVGARPLLIGGLIGFAAASLLFVAAGDPDLLGAARFAQGVAAAAFSPAAGTLVAHVGGSTRRGGAFGGYGGAKGLGYLAGPLGGGALVALGGYSLLFTVLAVVAVLVAVWAAAHVHPAAGVPRARETLAGLARRLSRPAFVRPVAVLAASTAALSAGIGFLPVQGARAHLGPLVTGAIVSGLAAAAALVQPWAGRALDRGRLVSGSATTSALAVVAMGYLLAAVIHGPAGLVPAALLIGAGVGVATPLGFAALADAAPEGRMGQTMGAGEVGRELGDAGGPLLVGALSVISLGIGLAGLGAAMTITAAATMPRRSLRRRHAARRAG
jgi:MFS family permease